MLFLEIDVDAVRHNIATIRKATKSELNAVIKANCYGHGIELAKYIEPDVDSFSVACSLEANEVRALGITKKLYILGAINQDDFANVPNAVHTVCSPEDVDFLLSQNQEFSVAVKVNTGMNRLGARPEQLPQIVDKIKANSRLSLDSIFTHFYNAQEGSHVAQFDIFQKATKTLSVKKHCCASTCLWLDPKYHLDMVRCGIALYGYGDKALKPALKAYTTVAKIETLKAGETVGYGNYKLPKETIVATIRAGYADGYRRLKPIPPQPPQPNSPHNHPQIPTNQPQTPTNQPQTPTNQATNRPTLALTPQQVSKNGTIAPIIGQVSMDMTAIQAPNTLKLNDKVHLIDQKITAETLANQHQTIVYEILTAFSGKRIIREYKGVGSRE